MKPAPGWMQLLATMVEVCTIALVDYITAPAQKALPHAAAPVPPLVPPEAAPPSPVAAPPLAGPAREVIPSSVADVPPASALTEASEAALRPIIGPPPRLRERPPEYDGYFNVNDDSAAGEVTAVPPRPVPAPPPAAPAASSTGVPTFVTEIADRTAQIMRSHSRSGMVYAGFYPDGRVRFVESAGTCFEGRSENAISQLHEAGGSRTIEMHVGVSPESKLQISLIGGLHDGETLELEMIPEQLAQ